MRIAYAGRIFLSTIICTLGLNAYALTTGESFTDADNKFRYYVMDSDPQGNRYVKIGYFEHVVQGTDEDISHYHERRLEAERRSTDHYIQQVAANNGELLIPSSVTYEGVTYHVRAIAGSTFQNVFNLKTLKFNAQYLTTIEQMAFFGCEGLESISHLDISANGIYADGLPESVKVIGVSSFKECKSLRKLIIPGAVTNIYAEAFVGCESLTDVEFQYSPSNNTPLELGSSNTPIFSGCTEIQSVYLDRDLTGGANSDFSYSYLMGIFSMKKKLRDLEIGPHVTAIPPFSFWGCSALNTLEIPGNVTNIHNGAFSYCTGLINLRIGPSNTTLDIGYGDIGVTNPAGMFATSGNNLTSLIMHRNIQYSEGVRYGFSPFANCTKLTNVTLGAGVTKIEDYMFYGVVNLAKLTIPASVTSIYDYAFSKCTGLSELTLADGNATLNIGQGSKYGMFSDCHIKNLHIGRNIAYFSSISEKADYGVFSDNTYLRSVTFGPNVTTLPNHCFAYCRYVEALPLPDNLTHVGRGCFRGMSGLSQLRIPEGVTSIDDYTFEGCTSLISLTLSDNITSLGSHAMNNCVSLTGLVLPSALTTIGDQAFNNCECLDEIAIPSRVASIGDGAFNGCSRLTRLNICDGSTPLSLGLTQPSIGDIQQGFGLFTQAPLEWLHIGRDLNYNSLAAGGFSPFAAREALGIVTIGDQVTTLPNNLLLGCSAVTDIVIPASVTEIGNDVFSGCMHLSKVKFISGDKPLKVGFFKGTQLLMPLFTDCPVSNLELGRTLTYSISPVAGLRSLQKLTLTQGITSIGEGMFKGCSALEKLVIPESVTQIAAQAFDGCDLLNDIELADGNELLTIASGVFSQTSAACSVRIGRPISVDGTGSPFDVYITRRCDPYTNSPVNIPVNMWRGQTFASFIIPSTVTTVGAGSFAGCSDMTEIYSLATTPPAAAGNAFDGVSRTATTLFVPVGTRDAYAAAPVWKTFENIVESATIAPIETSYVFNLTEPGSLITKAGKSNLTKAVNVTITGPMNGSDVLTLRGMTHASNIDLSQTTLTGGGASFGDGLTPEPNELGDNFFKDMERLAHVSLPQGLTRIGREAFGNCWRLTELEIPSTVTRVSDRAFSGCTSLSRLNIADSDRPLTVGRGSSADNEAALLGDAKLVNLHIGRNLNYTATSEAGYSPFAGQTGLKEATFGDNVTAVPANLLMGASALKYIDLPVGLKSIGNSAFANCTSLYSIDIPATTVGDNAFYGCKGLHIATLYASVDSIGAAAFGNCDSLAIVNAWRATAPATGTGVFYNVDTERCLLKVPGNYADSYTGAGQWQDFYRIEDALHITAITTLQSTQIKIGESRQLTAEVSPICADARIVNWRSGDRDLLSVSTQGDLRPRRTGITSAIAYATDDSGVSTNCLVTIVPSDNGDEEDPEIEPDDEPEDPGNTAHISETGTSAAAGMMITIDGRRLTVTSGNSSHWDVYDTAGRRLGGAAVGGSTELANDGVVIVRCGADSRKIVVK